MTTDWFWNFLGNQHLSQMKTQSHYKLVFQFSEKPAPTHRQSLQFGLWFSWPTLNGHFLKTKSLQIGSVIFLEMSTEHWKWLQIGFVIFLEINIWHFENTKSLQIGFLIFLEPSLNWPIMSTVWFINFFGHYKMASPNPSKKAKKKKLYHFGSVSGGLTPTIL